MDPELFLILDRRDLDDIVEQARVRHEPEPLVEVQIGCNEHNSGSHVRYHEGALYVTCVECGQLSAAIEVAKESRLRENAQ